MPKRNEEQRQKRNETRRKLKKLSKKRKLLFACIAELRNPDVYKEASDLYEFLNSLYPNKHDLTRTEIYQQTPWAKH